MDAPLKRPKDLEGKTVGAPPGDGQRQMFPAFAKLTGIDASKVTWVNIEPAAKVPALAEKRVDSVADYTTGLPFYEKAMGKGSAVMMPWADFGFDLYSMSIIASEKTMTQRAQVLRDFLGRVVPGVARRHGEPESRRSRSSRSACPRSTPPSSSPTC